MLLKRLIKRVKRVNDTPRKEKQEKRRSTAVDGVFVALSLSERTQSICETDSSSCGGSPMPSWRSSAEANRNMPLIVSDPDSPDEVVEDEAQMLGQVILKSKRLPSTWYYASNHIMINEERTRRMCAPLKRLAELDAIAREHAEAMASQTKLFHSSPTEFNEKFSRRFRRLGENVKSGDNIKQIHTTMMTTVADRNNILDRRFTHMGMATARGADGKLYLCQIFRG